MQFTFLILYLLFGGDLKTVKFILYVFNFRIPNTQVFSYLGAFIDFF